MSRSGSHDNESPPHRQRTNPAATLPTSDGVEPDKRFSANGKGAAHLNQCSVHRDKTVTTTEPTFLRELWPFFILGKMGEEACTDHSVRDLICPPTIQGLREVYGAVFRDTNPTAAAGLNASTDQELRFWVEVLRAEPLGKNEFMPAFLFHAGQVLRGLAEVVKLPLFERQDVFLAAMHQRGLA